MQFFTALITFALAATFATAAPAATCGGSEAFCCNGFSQPVDPSTGDLLSVPISVIASLQCTPVSVLSVVIPGTWYVRVNPSYPANAEYGGYSAQQSVCCQDVGSNGLVNFQCVGLQF